MESFHWWLDLDRVGLFVVHPPPVDYPPLPSPPPVHDHGAGGTTGVSYHKNSIAVVLVIGGLLLILSGDIETNPGPIAPTVKDLQVQLYNLIDWELFATHLPGIDQHDVSKISNDYYGVDRRKLELYKVWLDKCVNASWDHVIDALEKNRLYRLVENIKQWRKTNRSRRMSRSRSMNRSRSRNRNRSRSRNRNRSWSRSRSRSRSKSMTMSRSIGAGPGRKRVNSSKPKSTEASAKKKIENGPAPQPNGLEDIDWDLPSNDTAISPITIDDHNYEPKGTVRWNRQRDSAKGEGDQCRLVVVITNEYKGCDEGKGRLIGIKEDRKRLYKTFDREIFDLLISEDSTEQEMKETLRMTIEAIQKHTKPYKSAFIIFSGHGGMTKHKNPFIVSEDGKWVNLEKLICSFEGNIGDAVPKFFLIDACRNVVLDDSTKGAGVNTLHAYATKDKDKAYINERTGSYWIQEVTKLLVSKPGTLVNLIKLANKNVAKKKNQEPIIKVNTLNDVDYESDEKEGDPGTSSDGGDTTQDKNQATTPAIRTDNVNPTTTISCTTAQAEMTSDDNCAKQPSKPPTTKSTTNKNLYFYIIGGVLVFMIAVLVGVILK